MTCECDRNVKLLFSLEPFELGPAYEPYKSGKIHIPREFRQDEPLPKLLLPSCCAEQAFDATSYFPVLHFSLLSVWIALSAIAFVFYWPIRHKFPLNFRSPRTLIVFWANSLVAVTLISCNAAAGLTSPCHLYLIVMQINFPIQTFYFTVKSLQLAFAYNWNRAKMSDRHKSARDYHRFKYLLSDSTFLIGVVFFIIVGGAVHVTEMTYVDVYSPTLNAYSSIRAYWWHIPLEYRAPTGPNGTRGGMCSCWDLFEVAAGDTSLAQLNMTYLEVENACESGYLQDCLTNTECSTACPPSTLTSSNPSSSCKSWFIDYYSTGACGYPALFPNMASSMFCFGVYRPFFYFYCFLYLILLVVNLALVLSVLRMDDQLYMRAEVLFSFFNGVPCVFIILLEGISYAVKEELERFLPDYFFDLIIFYYIEYMALVCNIGFPILLAYYYQARTAKASYGSSKVSEGYQNLTRNKSILDSRGKPFQYEDELVFALNNDDAAQCYTKFAWKEFTVENIKFLQAVKALVDQAGSGPLRQSALSARKLFHMYIEEGSPFEVNISSSTRNIISLAITGNNSSPKRNAKGYVILPPIGINTVFALHNGKEQGQMCAEEENTPNSTIQEPHQELDELTDLEEYRHYNTQPLYSIDQLLECFRPAVQDIKALIMRDSWPRFRKSPFFEEFRQLFTQQQAFDATVGTILRTTDQKRRSSTMLVELPSVRIRRTSHQKRNSSSMESTLSAGMDTHPTP